MPDSEIAIAIQGLSKQYHLGATHDPYARLSESLWNAIRHPRSSHSTASHEDTFWALRGVDAEIRTGEVVGVIGRNGAGKSTLLKILSRITDPTEGQATLRGRVGSLLEVGTGFHPELSGRENIFLAGSILGMRRSDILRRFDEIIDFAEIDQFLDTPVKRYSSGMQVRLGFAVAAHLEPDILLVDEVLAVGDANFQAKSLGRMENLSDSGRTVMFISHSMQSVLRLCSRAILLDKGQVLADGPTSMAVRAYLESDLGRTSERHWASKSEAPGDDVARLKSIKVVAEGNEPREEVDIERALDIEVQYWSESPGSLRPFANLHFFNEQGICLFVSGDFNDRQWRDTPRRTGVVTATCHIPGNFLAEGRITVTAAVSTINPVVVHAIERDAIAFQVVDRSQGDGARGTNASDFPGVLRPLLEWDISASA